MPARRQRHRAASPCEVQRSHWYPRGSESLVFRTAEVNGWPQLPPGPLWNLQIEPRAFAKQQVFKSWAARFLHPAPFFDRNENGSLHSTARHNLRTVIDGGVKKFAETGFRIL